MFQYLVIVVLAGFVGILLFEFFTKKKTEVDGAHVVVTGGSSGIGKALAIKLAQCGANVTVLARNMSFPAVFSVMSWVAWQMEMLVSL